MTGISQEDARRYKEALERLAQLGGGNSIGNDIAKEAISPPQELEPVEVVHYAVYRNDYHVHTQPNRELAEEFIENSKGYDNKPAEIVELRGHYPRAKPQPVFHREEISCDEDSWRSVHLDSKIPDDASKGHFFYEWTE